MLCCCVTQYMYRDLIREGERETRAWGGPDGQLAVVDVSCTGFFCANICDPLKSDSNSYGFIVVIQSINGTNILAGPGNSRKFASGKIAKSFVAAARFCFIIIVMFNTHPPSTQTMFSCYQLFVLMRGQQHGKCGLLLRKLLYSCWDLGKSTDKSMTMIFQGVAQFFYRYVCLQWNSILFICSIGGIVTSINELQKNSHRFYYNT